MAVVLSLLGGAAAAALIGLLGAWIQGRREHVRWLREKRYAAYLDFLHELERMVSDLAQGRSISKVARDDAIRLERIMAEVKLLGPALMMERSMDVADEILDATEKFDREKVADRMNALYEAARKTLKVDF